MAISLRRLEFSKKKIIYALQEFFGMGLFQAKKVCNLYGLSPNMLAFRVPKTKLIKIKIFMEKELIIDDKLIARDDKSLKKLQTNRSYRGIRLERGLPVRGQRTRSNANTQRRNKKKFLLKK